MIGPLAYIGGKRRIARQLIALIPQLTTYVEPFAGGAQLFFHKPRSRVEVLNDLDEEIVRFFRVCQRHPHELARVLRWQPASRRVFDADNERSAEGLTDIERAARFYYLQKNAWGGKRTRRSYHYGVTVKPNYNPSDLPVRLLDVADRLLEVQVECLPWEQIVDRYDRTTTFFYLDPPYVGVDLYRHNFTDSQFASLAERLKGLAGKFLLSINDCPQVREWFNGFHRREITLTYTSLRRPKQVSELLFANFPLTSPADTLKLRH